MLELLFLLLPIAAAYGWYMGSRNARHRDQEQAHHLSRQYVAGLNLILSDQPDKAVDLFIGLLDVDHETIDTHLALGNLFRSRGEVDRAIRIHQNLIARSNLTLDQRNLSLQQLAKDYMVAGFFDRAEKIFHQLMEEPEHKKFALEQLLAIYQQTKEWDKAIQAAERLVKIGKVRLKKDISHFYCELANEAKLDGDSQEKKVKYYLKKAISSDKSCVRAALELATIALKNDDQRSAIKILENIIDQDKDFVSESLPLLKKIYLQSGNQLALKKYTQHCIDKRTGATAELMMTDFISSEQDLEAAETFLTRQLTRNPTMQGFHKLIELHVEQAEDGRGKNSLNILRQLVEEQLNIKPHYRCRKCGFSTHSIYWHCPSCKGWGSIKPIKGLDGE